VFELRAVCLGREFKAIFFDLDGTLVDIHGPLYIAARNALGVALPLAIRGGVDSLTRGFQLKILYEFAALLIGLTVYTGSFIAEIVRAGILAVSWGQSEAASALGLRPSQRMRLIVLPQALRVIVPPMTSEYLSLTKNSSLAVAIGYPDLVSIAGTTMNQTGQAVEGIAMIMAVYLVISLLISLFMNLYNRSVALVER